MSQINDSIDFTTSLPLAQEITEDRKRKVEDDNDQQKVLKANDNLYTSVFRVLGVYETQFQSLEDFEASDEDDDEDDWTADHIETFTKQGTIDYPKAFRYLDSARDQAIDLIKSTIKAIVIELHHSQNGNVLRNQLKLKITDKVVDLTADDMNPTDNLDDVLKEVDWETYESKEDSMFIVEWRFLGKDIGYGFLSICTALVSIKIQPLSVI